MGISLKQNNGATINPTNNYIPRRVSDTAFADSVLLQTGDDEVLLDSDFNGNRYGLSLQQANGNIVASLGDYNGLTNETAIVVNDDTGVIHLKGTSIIDTPGVVVPSPNMLRLTINGTNYLISLST